jgi:MFS family permease
MLVFALGECIHGAVHGPLGVDLAPPQLLGRYTALSSLSWQVGWIIGPAAGGFVLQHAPLVLWPVAAGLNVCCAAAALALEPRLPARVRTSPRALEAPPLGAGAPG